MSKVKVIELSGQKLDPNAKYLFLIDRAAMPIEMFQTLTDRLIGLIGDNFVIGATHGDPNKTTKAYEFAPHNPPKNSKGETR